MDNILKIENLKKIYHTKQQETLAVEDFSFELKPGEFVAIVGPSGCGKSTILSILCGLEEKSGGKILTVRPQQNLVLKRSSKSFKSSGDLSEDIIICLLSLYKVLNV